MENGDEDKIAVSEKRNITENRSYNEENYRVIFDKTGIKSYREVSRDGNCMYLTISVQIIDKIQTDSKFKKVFDETLDKLVEKFKSLKLEEFTYSDYLNTFKESLDVDIHEIEKYCWYEIVGLLRLITSTELRINRDVYLPYIPDTTIEQYCKTQVDPFFVEAGYLEIGAIVNALPIRIKVYDITENTEEHSRLYGNEGEVICILHTPNHFEPIYF